METIAPLPRSTPVLSGALALVPRGQTPGSEKLLLGFRAVLQKQGPTSAIQWLVRQSMALQALVRTPAGRGVLVAVVAGASVGWTVGSNARKAQALATALKAVADQKLPADQTAKQVGQVLRAALSSGQRVLPSQGTSTAWAASARPDTLAQTRVKLLRARQSLKESEEVLKQNPSNPGQREIVQARRASVAQLEAKPPLPAIPKEIDRSDAGKQKTLDGAGDVMHRQRVKDYENGGSREQATRGLKGEALTRMQAALDAIDRSRLPPGGATGGRKVEVSTSPPDDAKPTRATRRSKAERLRGISRKILKERFDGKNVSARFISTIQRAGDHSTTAATPAKDSDQLTSGSPVTVGDVKKMLGRLNNSIISIKRLPMGLVVVNVESKGFRAISLMLRTSSQGIDEITVGEISTGGSRTPQRNAATNEVMPDLDTRQPLVGALLGLKILQYAEHNNVPTVSARAAVGPANSESGDLATQGARVWPTIGLDGPIGEVDVVRVQKFLRNHPTVAEKVGLRSVTGTTRVLDLLADSAGNLVPEAMGFWRASPNSYDGRVDLSDKSSRSYLIYQRALEDYGLK